MVTMSDIPYTWTSICMLNVCKIGNHYIGSCDLAFQCEWDRGNAVRPLQNFPQYGPGFSKTPSSLIVMDLGQFLVKLRFSMVKKGRNRNVFFFLLAQVLCCEG